jgi:hypothetical protein
MVEAIRVAVGQCVTQQPDGVEMLRRCVRTARSDGVKPEHVVVLIRTAWDHCAANASANAEHDLQRLRLTGVALDAYFADD